MPRYDYRCPACELTLEETHSINGEVPQTGRCPSCQGLTVRVFTAPAAILFHGPGFYTTDVKKRLNTKRRPNPGDDLHKEFDQDAATIADAI